MPVEAKALDWVWVVVVATALCAVGLLAIAIIWGFLS